MGRRLRAAALAAVGVALLSGCMNVDGELQVDDRAGLSGQYAVRLDKVSLAGAGINSIEELQERVEQSDLAPGIGSVEGAQGVQLRYEETAREWVVTADLAGYSGGFVGMNAVRGADGGVLFTWSEELGAPLGTPNPQFDVTVDLPGPITGFDNGGNDGVVQVDEDTIRVATDQSFDVRVTAEAAADGVLWAAAGAIGTGLILGAASIAALVRGALRGRRRRAQAAVADQGVPFDSAAAWNSPSDTLTLPVVPHETVVIVNGTRG